VAIRGLGTGITFTPALAGAHASGSTVTTPGTGITFTPALVHAWAVGTSVRPMGSGITFTPALALAHASGAAVTTIGSGIGSGITFTPALSLAHPSGITVTGSGDPSSTVTYAQVTPRLIARLEVTYSDGTTATVVSNSSWKTALGPTTYSNWYSGEDYNPNLEQPGWDLPNSDLSATATSRNGALTGWINAGIAPPPNVQTKLVWRPGEPVKIVATFPAVSVTNPATNTWVFDLGQNFSGFPQINIPAGVDEGTRLRLANEGQPGPNGGPHGDLYVLVKVKPHPFLERHDTDLHCTIPINVAQAALGAEIEVPTLEQPQKLKIPEGAQTGAQFRLRHKGVPALNGGARGDLIVHLDVRTPTRVTREQRKLLEQLRDSLPVDNAPAEKGLFEKVKDYFM